jgi:hypothetical protein
LLDLEGEGEQRRVDGPKTGDGGGPGKSAADEAVQFHVRDRFPTPA